MKKILSILLVLTLAVFAMASTVSAANEAGTVYDITTTSARKRPAPSHSITSLLPAASSPLSILPQAPAK